MDIELRVDGFVWGPVEVKKYYLVEGPQEHRAILIKTEYREIQIYVSKTGRSVRVFENGKELKSH